MYLYVTWMVKLYLPFAQHGWADSPKCNSLIAIIENPNLLHLLLILEHCRIIDL
jgi:hypothetical protein